jgi:hypothetical protein
MDERINDSFTKKRHALQRAKVEAFLKTQGVDVEQCFVAWTTLTAGSDRHALDDEAYRLAQDVSAFDLNQGGDGVCVYAVTHGWIVGHWRLVLKTI